MTPYFARMLECYRRTDRATPAGWITIPPKELVDEVIDRMELQMMGVRYE